MRTKFNFSAVFIGCAVFDSTVFPNLVKTLNGGLHMMVILFLLVAVGFALVSLSFCIYNARKVPYQSIKGHKGLYLWNFIAGKSSCFSDDLYETLESFLL